MKVGEKGGEKNRDIIEKKMTPSQRGAAWHSWRIMQDINKTRLTVHEVSSEIDKGNICIDKLI